MFMATLDNLVMTNALPVIHEDLGASVEELQWFINAYTLAFASFILMAVALGDRFGRRTVFIVGIAIFTARVASPPRSAPTRRSSIVARAIQGLGGAGIMPLSLVAARRRGRAASAARSRSASGAASPASASRSVR